MTAWGSIELAAEGTKGRGRRLYHQAMDQRADPAGDEEGHRPGRGEAPRAGTRPAMTASERTGRRSRGGWGLPCRKSSPDPTPKQGRGCQVIAITCTSCYKDLIGKA